MATNEHSTVVITGASSGIGRALALEMAARGHALGLTARRMALLERLRDEIHAAHGNKLRVELATVDVCETVRAGRALHELFARLGGVDTIVVNAGANDITRIGGGDLEKELNLIRPTLSARLRHKCGHRAFCGARQGAHRRYFLAGLAAAHRNASRLLCEQGRLLHVP